MEGVQITESGHRRSQRARNQASTDARRERTRRAILKSLEEIRVQDEADLTVSTIAAKAGISRSSFYAHFSSLTDLAESLMISAMDASVGVMESMPTGTPTPLIIRSAFESMSDHFAEYRALYRGVLALPGAAAAFPGAVAKLTAINFAHMERLPYVPENVDRRTLAIAIAWSHVGVYSHWLRGELDVSVSTLIETLFDQLPEWFRDP